MIGFLAGLGAALAVAQSLRSRASMGSEAAGKRAQCSVSILLLAPHGELGRSLDRATGSRGFSHVAWDACEEDEQGQPLAIDCTPSKGVHRAPLEPLVARQHVRVYVPEPWGREAYGCVRARLGQRYSLGGMLRSESSPGEGSICTEMVMQCLPDELAATIANPAGRGLAPNDIARSWGIPSPRSNPRILYPNGAVIL